MPDTFIRIGVFNFAPSPAMNLRAAILLEHSKTQSLKIAAWIGGDAGRFAGLIALFLTDEYRVVQRAAWIVSIIAEKHPELIQPHIGVMVRRMQMAGLPSAVKRNVLRILQNIPLPEALHGEVMSACFDFLADPREPIAIRAFSMSVLGELAKQYPDIKSELKLVIEDGLEQEPSAGYKARARKVLGKL